MNIDLAIFLIILVTPIASFAKPFPNCKQLWVETSGLIWRKPPRSFQKINSSKRVENFKSKSKKLANGLAEDAIAVSNQNRINASFFQSMFHL